MESVSPVQLQHGIINCNQARIDRWLEVMRSVTDSSLQSRLDVLTLPEIRLTWAKPAREHRNETYGI